MIFVNKVFQNSQTFVYLGDSSKSDRESQMLNRSSKLVRLHMGHLVRPKIAAWYDFCHTKNLKFVLEDLKLNK